MSSLFIGLGGVGTGTLECLNRKMREYNDSLQSRGQARVQAYYYYIDTDQSIYNEDSSRFNNGSGMSFKLLGQKSPNSLIDGLKRVEDTYYADWYDAPSKSTNLILGADTTRQYSRLALKAEYQNIKNDLTNIIRQVVSPQSRGRIYVVTGSCGGTGCGIYMDLLYMINQIYADLRTQSEQTDVRLIMAMPEGYIPKTDEMFDIQRHKTLLNAYGTLTELNAVCKDTYTKNANDENDSSFSFCNVNKPIDLGPDWSFGPFRFGYLYDSADQSREVVSQKIADFVFEIELAGKQIQALTPGQYSGSAFDILLTGFIESDWNNTANNPFTKPFCSMGQFSIEKPDELWRKYFKERLLYEVFHKGLIDSGIYDANTSLITTEGNTLYGENGSIINEINDILEEIKQSVTQESLKDENSAETLYNVFIGVNDYKNELVQLILEKKDILLDRVKKLTYRQCREWLKKFDFTTVYKIVDWLDYILYQSTKKDHSEIKNVIDNAKDESKGRFGKWKKEKAVEKFNTLLEYWLKYEVKKALTAGINNDITIDSNGYLDECKSFINKVKLLCLNVVPREVEDWESKFKRTVADLKIKDDRCYLPDLSEIMDDNSNIPHNSPMVSAYENQIVVSPQTADLQQGTCTIDLLREEVIRRMVADRDLLNCRITVDWLYDPAPDASDNLLRTGKAERFMQEYIRVANDIIDELINANRSIQGQFNTKIVDRLAALGNIQRANVCRIFQDYKNVELRTVNIPEGAVRKCELFISNFAGNTLMQQALGIIDNAGNKMIPNSAILDDPYYSDKIVKLIVKEGYSIDQYRFYKNYYDYAKNKMKKGESHDPFIDKRFKGTVNGDKYEMDVFKAMRDIMTEARREADETQREQDIQDEYLRYSLDGISESEIYTATLSILYQYFNYLKKDKIRKELNKGISLKGTVLTFKKYEYRSGSGRFFEKSDVDTVDLKKAYGVNDFIELDMWIDEVLSHKDDIKSEKALIEAGLDFCYDNGIAISSELDGKIGSMKGTDAKPLYDFLRAYQIWLKNLR